MEQNRDGKLLQEMSDVTASSHVNLSIAQQPPHFYMVSEDPELRVQWPEEATLTAASYSALYDRGLTIPSLWLFKVQTPSDVPVWEWMREALAGEEGLIVAYM